MHLRHQTQRVNPNSVLHYLKMQMEAGAVAGIAYITYNLPCRYRFTCGDGSLHHMGIACGQTRAVVQQNLIAVAVVPAADQHHAAVGSQDGVPSGAGISVPRCPALPKASTSPKWQDI